MAELAVPILYIVLKYAAYSAWCYRGLKKFRPLENVSRSAAYRFGFYRLLIGLFFGLSVGAAVFSIAPESATGAGGSSFFLYLCIYLPVRWIEWMILSIFIIPGSSRMGEWLVGLNRADRIWRLGRIGVSFLADLVLIISAQAFPVGRILC